MASNPWALTGPKGGPLPIPGFPEQLRQIQQQLHQQQVQLKETAAAAKAALQRLEDRFLLKPKLQLFELPIFSSEIRAAMALVAFVGGLVCFRFDCVILRIHAYSIKEHCTHVFASLLTI